MKERRDESRGVALFDGSPLDKRNFRKKMLSIGLIKEAGKQKKSAHRPAQLYLFTKKELTTIPEVRAAL